MKRRIIIPVILGIWGLIIICMGYLIGSEELVQDTQKLVSTLTQIIIIGCIVTFALIIVINHVLSEISAGFKNFEKEAKAIGLGKYNHKMNHYELPEVESFSTILSQTSENVYREFRKLKYEKAKMSSIVHNLDEGLIIIDSEGYIKEMNRWARHYFKIPFFKPRAFQFQELMRHKQVLNLVEDVLSQGEKKSCEVENEKELLRIEMYPIDKKHSGHTYIISIKDVTSTKKLENMRYQFVSNVTHELKTPLTSIRGFVETLKSGALEDPKVAYRFLSIIEMESERLYRLIQDILMLSEIENQVVREKECVNISEVIEEICVMLKQENEEKQIKLEVDVPKQLKLANVSKDHMKQLFLNLMNNAIKYTDQGKVSVSGTEEKTCFIFEIKDTGIGIPKESLDRIFERFYRVDKGRDRKSGGTGLGLSIVKHIVQLYHGEITVESDIGKGTTFTIKFNK